VNVTWKRSVVVALVAQLVLLICLSSGAAASAGMTKQKRTAFEHAMARYTRLLAATTVGDVTAQMAAEESRIQPCVTQLRSIYRGSNPNRGAIDWILGAGAHDSGERWYANAAIPVDQAIELRARVAEIKQTTSVDVCGVIEKWQAQRYAPAHRPPIYKLLAAYVGPSPVAAIGARNWVQTFRRWGFRRTTANQLVVMLNKALARYSVLNAAAGAQFASWLQQQGIYQLMQPLDRDAMAFARY
jgi:hypothetical protein